LTMMDGLKFSVAIGWLVFAFTCADGIHPRPVS
jgi:hypothetical protein